MTATAILVTARLDSQYAPLPGSTMAYCTRCNEHVLLSPSSQRLLAQHRRTLVIVCLECFGGTREGNPV